MVEYQRIGDQDIILHRDEDPHRKAWAYMYTVYKKYAPFPKSKEDSDRMLLTLMAWKDKWDPVYMGLRSMILDVFQRNRASDRTGAVTPDFDACEVWRTVYKIFERFPHSPVTNPEWIAFYNACNGARKRLGTNILLECLLHMVNELQAAFPREISELKRKETETYFWRYPGEAFMTMEGEDDLD
ncbi:MAG: hypothetical protein IK127_08205 [Clostridia bacterium]|nr:hypothetical protein [Clostridia bacterium]